MKKLLVIGAVVGTLFLTGCATTPKVNNVVIKPEIRYITPPDNLIKDFDVSAPPDRVAYSELACDAREVVLAKYVLDLMDTVKKYRYQTNLLRNWETNVAKLENSKVTK